MTKSNDKIAEEANPGWRVVPRNERTQRVNAPPVRAQAGTPDLTELRRRYLGDAAAASHDGFQSASAMREEDVQYVEMEPVGGSSPGHRRTVIISNGKAVAIQG